MSLKQVKNKIVATKKTGQVTKAMESVSAVKMRKSQERAFLSRPYIRSAIRVLRALSGSQDGLQHPLAQTRSADKELLIIVTSDKGLAGSVNSAVLKRVEQFVAKRGADRIATICIGRKALEFAKRNQLEVVHEFTNVSDDVSLDDVESITTDSLASFVVSTYEKVSIVYQNFLSTFEQEPVVRQLLPLRPEGLDEIVAGIKPRTGKWSDDSALAADAEAVYTVEPSPEVVLDTLIPQLVQIMLYHALLESKASEHSARMVAMKNATDKSKEVVKALTIKYNKARQAAITAEVSEITAGVEAMK